MNAQGPVLRDIHVPPAAWWPPAPGWWLLAGLLALVCVAAVAWRMRRARRGPLRTALREVDALEADWRREADTARLVDRASRLLRRVARRIEPGVASKSGDAWRAFILRHAHDDATRQSLDQLLRVRFDARPAVDVPALCTALRVWCTCALRRRGMWRRADETARGGARAARAERVSA